MRSLHGWGTLIKHEDGELIQRITKGTLKTINMLNLIAGTPSNVQDERIKNQVTDSVESCNDLATKGGGRARLGVASSDVCSKQYPATSRASEMHDDFNFTNDGGRGNLRGAHSEVPISILQHTSIECRLWGSMRIRDIKHWRLTPRCMVTGLEFVLRTVDGSHAVCGIRAG